MKYSEQGLIQLYRLWSEEFFAASFISPSSETVKIFRKWVKHLEEDSKTHLEDYEKNMIMEYYKQEHNNEM